MLCLPICSEEKKTQSHKNTIIIKVFATLCKFEHQAQAVVEEILKR